MMHFHSFTGSPKIEMSQIWYTHPYFMMHSHAFSGILKLEMSQIWYPHPYFMIYFHAFSGTLKNWDVTNMVLPPLLHDAFPCILRKSYKFEMSQVFLFSKYRWKKERTRPLLLPQKMMTINCEGRLASDPMFIRGFPLYGCLMTFSTSTFANFIVRCELFCVE